LAREGQWSEAGRRKGSAGAAKVKADKAAAEKTKQNAAKAAADKAKKDKAEKAKQACGQGSRRQFKEGRC
jgi:hypothetical protein